MRRMGLVGVMVALAMCLVGGGCRALAPGGVYNGDKVLAQSELAISTSHDVASAFLKWEKANRSVLPQEVKQFAFNLRRDYPQWHATAYAVRDSYVAGGSDATALQKAIAVLQTAVAQAAGYMTASVKANP